VTGLSSTEVVKVIPDRIRSWPVRRIIYVAIALCVSAVVLGVLAFGCGHVPALGPALVPGHGVWPASVAGAVASR
jgi:hypothetical protein